MSQWNTLVEQVSIDQTVKALTAHNIHVIVVDTIEEAKQKALELIPPGAEVMTMTSKTLEAIGLEKEINESGHYNSNRNRLMKLDRNTQKKEMKILGGVPDVAIGSVHAITEDGRVLIASASGSQLPAYVYGADKVIWIAGTQKIVKNVQDGMKRIEEYTLPLENERAKKAYGVESAINHLLIYNADQPRRITLILVKKNLGF